MTKIYLREDTPEQAFPLGTIYITCGVEARIAWAERARAIARHAKCDWGELDADDWQENELSLKAGSRLLSAYRAQDGTKFWVITEADRSCTTILLPEEY